MQVRTSKLGVAIYLTPDSPLIEENIATLAESVSEARGQGMANLVVDLHRVTFLDSRGLEYLVDLANTLGETGGSLRLVGANELCKDVLAVTRIDQTIPVYEDLESAGRSFL